MVSLPLKVPHSFHLFCHLCAFFLILQVCQILYFYHLRSSWLKNTLCKGKQKIHISGSTCLYPMSRCLSGISSLTTEIPAFYYTCAQFGFQLANQTVYELKWVSLLKFFPCQNFWKISAAFPFLNCSFPYHGFHNQRCMCGIALEPESHKFQFLPLLIAFILN